MSTTEQLTSTPSPPAAARQASFLAKAFGITAVLSAAGSGLGLLRDLLLARFFGADEGTDAFLVSWTVPETAAPLLIEDAMAFLMVPAFSLALVLREEDPQGRDPVRQLTAATLPWLLAGLCALSGATMLWAPELVHALAPGLADPGLAITCTRLTAVTILPFGAAGYFGAALRAHHRFTAPAAIYVAYNLGILGFLTLCHTFLGVRSAALGVAFGSLLMVGVLIGPYGRALKAGGARRRRRSRTGRPLLLSPTALLPVAAFTLTRQSQVFIERYLGSDLPPGTISHLNYAAKVSQLAMTTAILICTVTFPLVARALAAGDLRAARDRVEKDLGQAAAVVLAGTAFLIACAPAVVSLLFERGAFSAADTTATARVIQVYSFGLLAQALIGVMVRPFFSMRPAVRRADDPRPADPADRLLDWYPVGAMAVGLLVTTLVGVCTAPHFGALGLAAGNAAGITTTAALLLHGLALRGIALRTRRVLGGQARLVLAAAGATLLGGLVSRAVDPALPALLAGGSTVLAIYLVLGTLLGAREITGPVRRVLRPLLVRSTGRPPTGCGEGAVPAPRLQEGTLPDGR
ncbi:murein biosynthesis integral membrane protein MurJ [Kitasatospora viridis]|uniref:Putative peptidoglycan lipid II flippase n=1 Tax=Kitasatospora viridis TaxID=281105 RepID=A0A561UD66_9ACTN|nr:lipid II flippase MurJ [Kitasatospora viridis]TWF97278.1 putative peptidoglycan lipid II flippase [Kitasatospora viridis]